MSRGDFRPTAALQALRVQARMLQSIRRFFDSRGFWEVTTPLLSADATVDPNLCPFVARWVPAGAAHERGRDLYLQTSPEFAMKRLLAAGADAIYQVTKAFRNGELGRLHNPEFTIVEWYRVGDTYVDQMDFTEELVRAVAEDVGGPLLPAVATRFKRTSYRGAFQRHVGCDPLTLPTAELPAVAEQQGLTPPPSLAADDRDGWLNLLLAARVEPELGRGAPEFLYDYPASQAALARIRLDDPPVAERFELYIDGIELCNGYQELTDAEELRLRVQNQLGVQQPTSRLLDAMDAGLPDCSGVELGFDRLAMLAADATSLAEVIAFPFDRA